MPCVCVCVRVCVYVRHVARKQERQQLLLHDDYLNNYGNDAIKCMQAGGNFLCCAASSECGAEDVSE